MATPFNSRPEGFPFNAPRGHPPPSTGHLERREKFEAEKNPCAAALQRSFEHHARTVVAFDCNQFDKAYAHFVAAVILKPLSPEQQELFDVGKAAYAMTCIACHHSAGYGEAGKGPPLIDFDWVRGSPERLARMVLHGMRGLTYVHREFGDDASPIKIATVRKIREATTVRTEQWTEQEVLKFKTVGRVV